jgi:hypothetical protein
MTPVKSVEELMNVRDLAYANIVGKMVEKGQMPSSYDVRPVSPYDDLTANTTFTTQQFAPDWSILANVITDATGALTGTGNTILAGAMPQDRFLINYGLAIETPGSPAEVMWSFKGGANTKCVYFLQDLMGYEHPRAVTSIMPCWGPTDPLTWLVYAVAARPVQDVHYTFWGEPTGTTITASNLRA